MLCDASEGVAEQDARLLGLSIERRRAVVVGLNKIDTIPRNERNTVIDEAGDVLAFARWAPLIGFSAKTGAGSDELTRSIVAASEEIHRRIPTAALNRFFREVLERQPPPTARAAGAAHLLRDASRIVAARFPRLVERPREHQGELQALRRKPDRKAFGFHSIPVTVQYRKRERRE